MESIPINPKVGKRTGVRPISYSKHIVFLLALLCSVALAEPQACIVCSVTEGRIHREECELSTDFRGHTFYFCKEECHREFEQAPQDWSERFAALEASQAKLSQSGAATGTPLPAFKFSLQPIGSVSSDDLRGKVVLLNLWATWCAPCKAEMPALVALQEEKKEQGLVVLALSFDKTRKAHEDGIRELNLNFHSFLAGDPEVSKFLSELGPVAAIPVTIVVDREGQIVEYLDSGADLEKFRALVEPYLKTPQPTSLLQDSVENQEVAIDPKESSSGSLVPS